ncbi:MarR family winged helix-turn-helix transcriptional regulator [Bacillus kwashiorkori]|uniref:MarR family winged helix-turn-helix transcriptional regulator n=1 Tax=Bacillus kwashiorkori TaxID=1522318 RepID=UPI000782C51E|nr:MarR family transcriptional regulator [Bacillus kwashiorkori]
MEEIIQRLQLAVEKLKRSIATDLQKVSITTPQLLMLHLIDKAEKSKLTDLAEKMAVKPSAITVMIDRLEKPGFVKRTHDPDDRRSIIVQLTPLGKEMLTIAIEERNAIIKTYLALLEPEEILQLTDIIEKVVNKKQEMK